MASPQQSVRGVLENNGRECGREYKMLRALHLPDGKYDEMGKLVERERGERRNAELGAYQENISGQTWISIHDCPLSESTCKLLNRIVPNGTLRGVEGEGQISPIRINTAVGRPTCLHERASDCLMDMSL